MNYIFFAGTILILPILYFILNRYVKKHRDWILKSFSLFLAVVFFIRYYSVSGSLLTNVWSLSINNPFSSSYLCFSVVILIWLQFTSVAVLWLLPFFKFKLLRNVAKYFCLVVNVLALGFMQQIIYAFTGTYNLSSFLRECPFSFLNTAKLKQTHLLFLYTKKVLNQQELSIFYCYCCEFCLLFC